MAGKRRVRQIDKIFWDGDKERFYRVVDGEQVLVTINEFGIRGVVIDGVLFTPDVTQNLFQIDDPQIECILRFWFSGFGLVDKGPDFRLLLP